MRGKKKPISILQRTKQTQPSKKHAGVKSKAQPEQQMQQHKRSHKQPDASGNKRRKTVHAQHTQRTKQPPSEPGTIGPTSQTHLHAAAAVRRLLEADEQQRGGISIKSLTLAPHIPAPAAVHAVTVETLKHLPIIQPLLERSQLVEQTPGLCHSVACVLVQDCLFGQGLRPTGRLERAVLARKDALRQEVQRLLNEAGAQSVAELVPERLPQAAANRPRSARVNTLKMSMQEALAWLRSPPPPHAQDARLAALGQAAAVDDLLPDLLLFPPGTDLHQHPLVKSGVLILQSKASCMPAHALRPQPGWQVVDACAAPGNKTTHLAALMRNQGSVLAFDKDPRRLQRLQRNARLASAGCIQAQLGDFLAQDPQSEIHSHTRAVLLDPSCSGSGTSYSRGDHLLPSAAGRPRGAAAVDYTDARVEALAQFQEAALRHALRFPAAQRVAYSTCSLHARENERVVAAVLPEARQQGWRLADPFPGWRRRGVPGLVEGAELLVRTDPEEDDTEGFFVALFDRDTVSASLGGQEGEEEQHAQAAAEMQQLQKPKKRSKKRKEGKAQSA